MPQVIATRATSRDALVGRHVNARDLHPGDVMQQHDWSLHVRDVVVGDEAVAIAVIEFGFPLHYRADEQIRLAA